MMHDGIFQPPEAISQADPALLADIQVAYPQQQVGFDWYPEGDASSARRSLPDMLLPLHEQIMEAGQLSVRSLQRVSYSIDTHSVLPGQTQRPTRRWHIDIGQDQRRTSVMVADVLPTEFISQTETAGLSGLFGRMALVRAVKHDTSIGSIADETMAELGLGITQPEPYQMVRARGQIHRSATNHSPQTLARTWIRANIIPN